jgi:ABC-type antimicrobial peptide transport system permease subunit
LEDPFLEVAGVVADSKYFTLGEPDQAFLYFPLLQNHETGMSLHVRTEIDPSGLIAAVEKEIRGLEKNLPLFNTRTMGEQMGLGLFGARMGASLLGSFALLALMLTLVGIYGVMSYTAAQRTHEIGIRLSLGAGRVDVLKMMLRDSMALVGIGMGLGLALALAATQLLSGFLYGVRVTDPAVLSGVVLLFTAVALLASYFPARRAMNVQPVVALRYE